MEMVVKKGQKWRTSVVATAKAETDIPMSTTDLINQRRRWLNGAFTATIYSLKLLPRVFESDHSVGRKALLIIQLLYNVLAFVLAWFSLAAYLLTVFIINDISGDPPPESTASGFPFGPATRIVNAVIQLLYVIVIVYQFILALGSRPKTHIIGYAVSFFFFAFVQFYFLMNLIYMTKRLVDFNSDPEGGSKYAYINEYYADVGPVTVIVSGFSLFGVYIIAAIISLDPWHLFTSWGQFLFISTSYTNILNIFAFCNIHDVSWGSKTGKKTIITQPREASLQSEQLPVVPSTENRTTTPPAGVPYHVQEQVDLWFEGTVRRALNPTTKEVVVEEKTPEESFSQFRTILISVYVFSNFLLCLVILNDSFESFSFLGDPYWHKVWFFRIFMWANSTLYLMKLVGCVCYWSKIWFSLFRFRRR